MAESPANTILVIEDDADIRDLLKMGLEMEGFSVRTAPGGQEALAYLDSSSMPPDLILLDLNMPKMNGQEFIENIRREPSSPRAMIPIIVLSAAAKSVLGRLPRLSGVIQKPVDFEDLFQAIRSALRADSCSA